MADRSTCLSPACGYSVEGSLTKCPKCGWAMRSPRNIRIRGWVLLGLGLFLVLFMGAITWNLLPTLLHPGKPADGMTFGGTEQQAEMFLGIFGLVILFGIFSVANGLYMIVRGRQNRLFALLALLIGVVLFAIAWAVRRKFV